jgi:cell surface protein SprA
VWNNIQGFGETTNYNHALNLNYKLPLDKFPIIDFLSSNARYSGTYRWDRAPFTQDTLGHVIQNSRNISLDLNAKFDKLYDKVPVLKEIRQDKNKNKRNNKGVDKDKVDGFGNEEEDDKKKKKSDFNPLHEVLRILMMVKDVQGSYTRNEGMLVPGYDRSTYLFGMDDQFAAPGWLFVAGHQNTNIAGDAVENFALDGAENGWFRNSQFQNQQYSETYSETWNFRANIEPLKHFKVELTANKQSARNKSSFFRFDGDLEEYVFDSPVENGNYSASIITWGTAFVEDDDNFDSEVFRQFLDNRISVSNRLNDQFYQIDDPENNGYYEGWGPTSPDVLIPAFVAAYTGEDIGRTPLDVFKTKVQPNWRISYDGLTKNRKMKKYFKQFSINHTYRSTLSTAYITNLNFEEDDLSRPTQLDQSEFANWISERQYNSVTISEQLSPLIGFDMTIKTSGKNDPQVKVEWKKDRTVGLSMTNYQVTETKSDALVIGVGYKFTDVPNPFVRKKKSRLPIAFIENTSIDTRLDLTIRDNVTLIRKVQENQNQVTAGQRIISIKGSVGLAVSDKLSINLFYDQQLTRPKISTSFPTSNINAGLALRFTLTG